MRPRDPMSDAEAKTKPETPQSDATPLPSDAAAETAIEIDHMHKWFGGFHVLKDINLKVMKGERIVICGPSGSGKSTLLQLLSGLYAHASGTDLIRSGERRLGRRGGGPIGTIGGARRICETVRRETSQ